MILRAGDAWGTPAQREPDLVLTGGDAALAAAVAAAPGGTLLEWIPDASTDLGRSIGLDPSGPQSALVGGMDVLTTDRDLAVNAIVWGAMPDAIRWSTPRRSVSVRVDGRSVWDGPAVSVVIGNGEFVGGRPVLSKAHPGDGILDVLVIGLLRSERRPFRARLARGDHLPHPRLATARGRTVEVAGERPAAVTIDGRAVGARPGLAIRLESDRYQLRL